MMILILITVIHVICCRDELVIDSGWATEPSS
jgi:hypothetical protein